MSRQFVPEAGGGGALEVGGTPGTAAPLNGDRRGIGLDRQALTVPVAWSDARSFKSSTSMGILIRTQVPFPFSLSISTAPPWASTT